MPAIVAIIGRPNVGKSTLFNRIIGKRRAIESPIAGTTRDSLSSLYEGKYVDFILFDTAGLEFDELDGSIEEDTQTQARLALTEADIILFCINTKEEITNADMQTAQLLRKNGKDKEIYLVGTKADRGGSVEDYPELYSLGVSDRDPFFLSAFHNIGVAPLLGFLEDTLSEKGFGKRYKRQEGDDTPIRLALIGRPNAGKSSLVNAISGREECIVSDVPGTTRDTKDTVVKVDYQEYQLIDTAGIRQRSKVEPGIEKYAMMRSMQAMLESDITLYVMDGEEGLTAQDMRILGELQEAYVGVVLVVNKWDTQEKGEEAQKIFMAHLRSRLGFMPWAPIVFVSAKTKKNVFKFFPVAQGIFHERQKRISTGKLNQFLKEAQMLHMPAGIKNSRPRIKYGSQIDINPPHFLFFGTQLQFLHFSYQRYLEHRIRDAFGFEGTGLKLEYRNGGENPYDKKKK